MTCFGKVASIAMLTRIPLEIVYNLLLLKTRADLQHLWQCVAVNSCEVIATTAQGITTVINNSYPDTYVNGEEYKVLYSEYICCEL